MSRFLPPPGLAPALRAGPAVGPPPEGAFVIGSAQSLSESGWYKRLEQGTFETVAAKDGNPRVRIDKTQLAMILGGVRLETA